MSDDDARTRFREPVPVETSDGTPAKPAATTTSAPVERPARSAGPAAGAPAGAPAPVEDDAARRRGGNTVLAVTATVLAVALLASTIVFVVLWLNARDDADTLAQTRRTVLATAQQTAVDFSSYDYRHLDRDFAQVAAQLTPTFRKSYQSTASALKATLSQYQAVGTAKVLDAGLVAFSGDKATVILFLDQTVTGKTTKTPSVERNRLRVKLQRTGGKWLVSALDVR